MKRKEYLTLCDVYACLNIAACTLNSKHSEGFINPIKSARKLILKSLRKIDKITIAATESNPELDDPETEEEKAVEKAEEAEEEAELEREAEELEREDE